LHQEIKLTAHNSTYKKLAVQWLNQALCFVSSFVVADSLVLRNRQLLVAANRCMQAENKPNAHCTHLQIAQPSPHPKFVKECNFPHSL
jgi:hypothetical protein